MPRTSRSMTAAERRPLLHDMTSVLYPIALILPQRPLDLGDNRFVDAAQHRELIDRDAHRGVLAGQPLEAEADQQQLAILLGPEHRQAEGPVRERLEGT